MNTEKRTIDGTLFVITQLPGRRSVRASRRVAATILPAVVTTLKPALKGAGGKKFNKLTLGDLEVGGLFDGLDAALPALFDRLTEVELDALIDELFASVMVERNGKLQMVLDVFDDVFNGRPLTVYKLLWATIGVNFGSFFDAIPGFGGQSTSPNGANPSQTSHQTSPSVGQSGASS